MLARNQPEPRKIEFQPGHRQDFWHRNCVAIGVSAGFVEPLEATALILIEKSAEWISQQLPRDRSAMSVLAKRFNEVTRQRWQAIVDFLKLHYALSERNDSDYWRDQRRDESIPESLRDALVLWRSQVPWIHESHSRHELFSSASIQYVLYGMRFRTNPNGNLARDWQKDAEIANRLVRDASANAEMLIASLPTNRDLLNQIGL